MRAADCLTHFSSQVTVAFLSWGLCLCPSALGEQQAIWAGKQASFSVREHLWASINHLPWQHTSSPTHISHLARETVKANPSLLLQPSKPQPHPITCSWWALENIFMTDFFFLIQSYPFHPLFSTSLNLREAQRRKYYHWFPKTWCCSTSLDHRHLRRDTLYRGSPLCPWEIRCLFW